MPDWPVTIVGLLARAAVLQLLAWLVVRAISSRLRYSAPQTCRVACLVILLQGVLLLPMTVSIPWYDPPRDQRVPGTGVATMGTPNSGEGRANLDGTESEGATLLAAPSTEPHIARHQPAADWDWSIAAAWLAAGLVVVWLAGMAVLMARSVLAYVRFVLCLPPSLPVPAQWRNEWEQLLNEHGVRRRIPLIVTETLGPMLCLLPWGHALLVPEAYWCESRRAERMAILRHELAHYRRGDVPKSWLAGLLALPSWFHPAAWWALKTFRECGEHGCDRAAVASHRERLDYASALRRLVATHAPVHAVGHCAHSHPLVSRVRFLLTSPDVENPVMKKAFLLIAVLALLAVHCVRVQLVAKEVNWTKESAKQRVGELDAQLKELGAKVDETKQRAAALKDEVEARLEQLTAKVADLPSLSEEAQRRVELLKSGERAKQLEAIQGADKLGDEGVLLLGGAADISDHQEVRRQAITTAIGLGKTGFPVLAHAMRSLPEEDQIFAIEQLAKDADDDKLLLLGFIAHKAEGKLHAAAVKAGAAGPKRVLFVAAVASEAEDAQIAELIKIASKFDGDDGLLLLYAAAGHTSPELRIAAMRAAIARGSEGLPVVAPALECRDPQVRAEVVRCAKKVGGEVAQLIIDKALSDPDEELRNAAKEALQEKE